MRLRWWLVVGGVVVVLVIAAAAAFNLMHAPAPDGYSSRTRAVEYYPACGNEVLNDNGRTWYPIQRDDWPVPGPQAMSVHGGKGVAASVPMVAAPGPGDNVGTLYVYGNGTAYWTSDSGELDTWLTLIPQSYNWVC